MFAESIFHNGRQIEDNGLDGEDVFVDLGDDRKEGIEEKLGKRIKEAVENGLFEKIEKKVKEIIQKDQVSFRIRLNS